MDIAQFKNRHKDKEETTLKISFYKKLSRKKWFKILKPFIIILIIILTITLLTWLGVFQIKKIEHSKELQYVTNLSEATDKYLGEGYFSLDLKELKQEIFEVNGYVKDVDAQKIFPNSITLTIEEYNPMYYLEYGENCYIFSQEGLILEKESEYEVCNLENGIQLSTSQNIVADKRLIFDSEISQVVQVLEEFVWEISTIEVDEDVLRISDGPREIVIESANSFDEQLAKLYLILEKVNIESIEYKYLDMRFERPVMELL
ncbi:FtsQ-type POTRA domain-containing protein [bacterium]|nr:FtsQ-type POTRA domain-containing protein [bacterium]